MGRLGFSGWTRGFLSRMEADGRTALLIFRSLALR